MNNLQSITAIVMNEELDLTIIEVCQYFNLPETVFHELFQLGLFEESSSTEKFQFNTTRIERLRSASRLFHDLKINAEGVVLALELLDEIEQLRQEVRILQRLSDD